ncbi:MAG: hypothetical protein M0Q91_18200 [Methanoregula sp.]|jgi:hypothetical protein|nr:hypothetical protein [Methanoregula sp.]
MKKDTGKWKFDPSITIKALDEILTKPVIMTDAVRDAVIEIKESIQSGDYGLAADVSTVKSFICGKMVLADPHNYCRFREDHEANEKVLGRSIYEILDGIHFDLAMATDTIPSGMMIVNSQRGITVRPYVKRSKSQTLRRIAAERKDMDKFLSEREKVSA